MHVFVEVMDFFPLNGPVSVEHNERIATMGHRYQYRRSASKLPFDIEKGISSVSSYERKSPLEAFLDLMLLFWGITSTCSSEK
ncbi:hypothetical protein NPIL_266251 [Nephila pilipes]|uniref:Uncharacterized protein n=1 Tax=Nephila pilipes TaxID=299642 RepID=A0A8X6NP89_NEPPI|nr:hypothetical protein NPIL_266251 [Nephila pilipes]